METHVQEADIQQIGADMVGMFRRVFGSETALRLFNSRISVASGLSGPWMVGHCATMSSALIKPNVIHVAR